MPLNMFGLIAPLFYSSLKLPILSCNDTDAHIELQSKDIYLESSQLDDYIISKDKIF